MKPFEVEFRDRLHSPFVKMRGIEYHAAGGAPGPNGGYLYRLTDAGAWDWNEAIPESVFERAPFPKPRVRVKCGRRYLSAWRQDGLVISTREGRHLLDKIDRGVAYKIPNPYSASVT